MRNYMKSVFAKHKPLIIFFAVFGVLIITAPIALGGFNSPDEGWRIDAGSTKAIAANTPLATWFATATNTKMIIANSSAASAFFIPTRTAAELAAFANYHPAALGVVSYCGNRNCEVNFGEGYNNCPSDCGYYNPTIGVDIICGDGRCDSKAENQDTCPQDCALGGCCVPRSPYSIPKCDLQWIEPGNTGGQNQSFYSYIGTCDSIKGCSTYKSGGYETKCMMLGNVYLKVPASKNVNDTQYADEKRATDCWAHTDKNSCASDLSGGTRNCYWIGQPDSGVGLCNHYCGDGSYNSIFDKDYCLESGDVSSTDPECGDHKCDYTNGERYWNCPRDCFSQASSDHGYYYVDGYPYNFWYYSPEYYAWSYSHDGATSTIPYNINTNGSISPAGYNGNCGNGVCESYERKGQSNYCKVDCGDAGEGLCRSFKTMCPIWASNNLSYYNPSNGSSGSIWESCSSSFLNVALSETECNKARNSNECNRFGCFWEKITSNSLCQTALGGQSYTSAACGACGNGVCDGSETPATCPRDCGWFFRTEFCEGPSTVGCTTKTSRGECEAMASSGCAWVTPGN